MASVNRPYQSLRIFLSGPFFTPGEIEGITKLEDNFETDPAWRISTEVFSPRRQHNGKPNLADPQVRKHIFKYNNEHLRMSDLVVVWIDRVQKPDHHVHMLKYSDPQDVNTFPAYVEGQGEIDILTGVEVVGGELRQPDIGTVWEAGYLHGLGKRFVGFTFMSREQAKGKLNLMITECFPCICYGIAELNKLVADWREVLVRGESDIRGLRIPSDPAWQGSFE